jgi:hypothetical protein
MMTDEKGPTQTAPGSDKVMLISFALAQEVLNYMVKQPCGEVYNMVTALLKLKEAPLVQPPIDPAATMLREE